MQDKYINPSLLEASLGCYAGTGEETERGSAERRKRMSKPRDQGEPKCLDYAVRGRGSSAHLAGEFRVEGRVYQPTFAAGREQGRLGDLGASALWSKRHLSCLSGSEVQQEVLRLACPLQI